MKTKNYPVKGIVAPGYTVNPKTVDIILRDLSELLYYNRVAQVHVSYAGKSEILDQKIKDILHAATGNMRAFEAKLKAKLPQELRNKMNSELSKDKLMDFAAILDLLEGIEDNEEHEELVTSMVRLLRALVQAKHKDNIKSMKKYQALIRFVAEELKAEAEGGTSSVRFDEKTNMLYFNLSQTDSQLPSNPTI